MTPPRAYRQRLLARLTTRSGPAQARLVERAGAAVVAVPGRYCVTYLLLGHERVFVVDVGSTSDHRPILEALHQLGRPPEQVRGILPTHLHMDHIIGVDGLARLLGVPVYLGPVAWEAVNGSRALRFPRRRHLLRATPTWVYQGAPRGSLEDCRVGLEYGFPWSRNRFGVPLVPCLEDDTSVLGLDGWTVLQTPGHADDAISLYHAGARFLVAGDTVRAFCGGEWNPLLCDPLDYERTRQRLLALDVETVFPGHGPILEGPRVMHRLRTLPRWAP